MLKKLIQHFFPNYGYTRFSCRVNGLGQVVLDTRETNSSSQIVTRCPGDALYHAIEHGCNRFAVLTAMHNLGIDVEEAIHQYVDVCNKIREHQEQILSNAA